MFKYQNVLCRMRVLRALCVILLLWLTPTLQAAAATQPDVRLYALNCGTINLQDGSFFSDTGSYPHQPIGLVDPCFLVKHNKSWLLWDLGMGDKYLGRESTDKAVGASWTVTESLVTQLKALGLTPNDITYVGISHVHFDHTGNADLFLHATWLMQRAEYQSLQDKPLPSSVLNSLLPIIKPYHKMLLSGDYDVFGDGTVVILRTPGHTIGHQSLQLNLVNTGTIILSGDLYHARRDYKQQQIPAFNESRADTLASRARIEGILKNTKGRLIIQHDPEDFAALPKSPKYLD